MNKETLGPKDLDNSEKGRLKRRFRYRASRSGADMWPDSFTEEEFLGIHFGESDQQDEVLEIAVERIKRQNRLREESS